MKKFLILFSMILLFSFISTAYGEWIPFQSSTPQNTTLNLINSNWDQITLHTNVQGVSTKQVETEAGTYSLLSMRDYGFTTELGSPQLPVIRKMVEIPYDANFSIEVSDISSTETTLSELGINQIVPVQPPLPKIEGATVDFTYNEAVYNQSEFYPSDVASLTDVGNIRGHRVIMVEIAPVRYNPVTEELSLVTDITLKINLTNSNLMRTVHQNEKYYSKQFERICIDNILNYNGYLSREVPNVPIGYLVIADDDFVDDIQDFVDWKHRKGFKVTVTPQSVAGGTTSQIKSYIQDAYEDWEVPPTYLLFVGDTNAIPAWNGEASNTPDDNKYGELEGNDLIPEIMLGRWAVETVPQLENILYKSMYTDNPTDVDLDWTNNDTFIASNDHGNICENTHDDMIDLYFDPNGMVTEKIYETYGGNTGDITAALNGGCPIVNYSGHGSWTTWVCVPFSISNVNSLNNQNMYPFVMSNACQTGNFGYSSESFGEAWIRAEGGAMSFFGASNNSYWDEDDVLERSLWEAYWENDFTTVGGICFEGLLGVYTHWNGGGSVDYYYDIYNVQGDPSLDVYGGVAQIPQVTLPPSIVVGQTSVTVEVDGGENALVCLMTDAQQNPIHIAGYTGGDGIVTFDLSDNPPLEICDWTIVVTGHNLVPYEATGMIFGGTAYEGYITDGDTDAPLMADVYIEDVNMHSRAAQEDGFYRLYVVDGNQDYLVEADYWGYQHYETTLYVAEDDTTDLDIALYALENAGTIEGYVTDVTGIPLSDVVVTLAGIGVPSVVTDMNGYYEFTPLVPVYEYQVKVSHPSYEIQSQTITLDENQAYELNFTMAYTEIFEENDGNFMPGTGFNNEWEWGQPTAEGGPEEGAYSGVNCWGTDLNADYNTNANMYLYSPYYTLSLSESPSLVFYTWYEAKEGWDGGNVKISTDFGENWEIISPVDGYPDLSIIALTGQPGFTGESEGWVRQEFDLTAYADSTVQIAFRFATTNSQKRGWFIDNFAVNGGYIAMAMPMDVSAVVQNEDNVILSWAEPNSPMEVMGYKVYRKTSDDDEFGEPIAELDSETFTYNDMGMDDGSYQYGIAAIYTTDMESDKCVVTVEIGTSIEDTQAMAPAHYSLSQNYPNPFNPTTQIMFSLPKQEKVSLKIYNTQGSLVKTLMEDTKEAGYYSLTWNGTDDNGTPVASGLYIYKVDAGKYSSTKRMLMLK